MGKEQSRTLRPVGRNAAALKYDLITALGAHGCAGDKHLQRLVLRLITVIVARYNWQSDELSVGQRELAQLWSVDERTVKREMARLRDLGWLVQRRPAARGRVAVHGLGLAAILQGTQGSWSNIGPDFTARMALPVDPPAATGNVVSFPVPPRTEGQGTWGAALQDLHLGRPDLCSTWFASLTVEAEEDGVWHLRAPSRFHASFVTTHHLAVLEAAMRKVDPGVRGVVVRA
ncbi:hypothetical protein SAMN05421774_103258 [Gemmobacter megaterium]|uniref:DnaA N-terminal domain-containing protein n=1 Tax=Gemmobacter megaterium TaxID=1086013 RepID=A0A1N7NB23_9RHOB|nr:hypothetical protein [Gemmobacter megaterium]GGE14038.1 hypothetical protein GCM10011345_19940 [Gemmobacter megaterium]SIS95502.1 hypothetical protein SAMN05421774_103258 [Gemmobacter megaterium]